MTTSAKRKCHGRSARATIALLVAWIAASMPSDVRAERTLSLFLLPSLVDELVEMAAPFEVNSDLGADRNTRFRILESRYCGANANRAGKFVAIAVPGVTGEDEALRTLGAADCRRSLIEVATASAAARRAQPWVAAASLRAVWKSSHLQWKLVDVEAVGAREGAAPNFSIPRGGLAIAEFATSDVRVAIDDRFDSKVQLAAAFFEDSARVSVSRAPLQSAPNAGPLDRFGAPSSTRAIAALPHEAVNSILQQDLIQQELVFNHSVSGEQRFAIQKARVASPGPEIYVLSGRAVHLGTDETFSIDVVFRGDDLAVESMTLEQPLEDCGIAPPISEFEAWTGYTECRAEFALRRGAAEVGSALLTRAYKRRALRPTGAPTPLQVWLGDRELHFGLSILKASVHGDALILYLKPSLSRGIPAP